MEQGATPRGPLVAGMSDALRLKYLAAEVTISCKNHGSHTATLEGPAELVIDTVLGFTAMAQERGRLVITQYWVIDEGETLRVSEWD
jgi:hypothetical protein